MTKNISDKERIIRIIVGGIILGWGIYARNWWGLLGFLPLLTGIIGFCGFYKLMGSCCPCCSKKKEG
jgi:hypothetical protein